MKKLSLKSKILLGAIMMGGMVAGAHTISKAPNADEPTYKWTSTPDAPDHPSSTLNNATREVAEDYFACSGEGEPCATGELLTGEGDAIVEIKLD